MGNPSISPAKHQSKPPIGEADADFRSWNLRVDINHKLVISTKGSPAKRTDICLF